MDAMVTARMPAGKKEAGNAVLRELGMSASQVINQLYDYLIAKRAVPFANESRVPDARNMAAAYAIVDDLPKVVLEEKYANMDAKDARRERLSANVAAEVAES